MRRTRSLAAPLIAALAMVMAILIAPAGGAAAQHVYYVAPNGNDSAAGTQAAPWRSIAHAQRVVQAGDTVYFRGGTYAYTRGNSNCSSQTGRVAAVTLNKSGRSGSPITYAAYPGETPAFDFFRMTDNCRIMGFEVTASWIHLKGLEIRGVPQNNNLNAENWGVWISGSNNIFEQLNIHRHMGTGLFINRGGGNLVLNSDSHNNYDPHTRQGPGESADGFGSHYAPAGGAPNVFRGCRAWWNADDGFDLISTYSPVIIENSWAWRNGYIPGTTTRAGNGAGFKAGGHGGRWDPDAVKHTVRGSVAFLNGAQGFYANHHPVANDFFNNTAFGNRPNFSMRGVDRNGNSVGRGTLRNNIAYNGTATAYMDGTNSAYNTWDLSIRVSDADFQSLSTSGWDAPRQADGSLPVLPHLRLAAGSALIDAGTNVGLPYNGSAPDLGAFETGSTGSSYVGVRNVATGLFLDGMGRTANGSEAGQGASSSSSNQQWEMVSAGSGYVRLRNRGTGLFLDGMGRTTDGAEAGQWASSSSSNQQWEMVSAPNNSVRFRNRATGLFLDGMGRTANGSDVGQWSGGGSSNQRWTIVAR